MKKLIKWFSIFAVIGTAVGLIVAYFCKSSSDERDYEDDEFFTEDEDFDLDADLQPTGREYVSLKKEDASQPDSADEPAETDAEAAPAADPEDDEAEPTEKK